MKKALVYSLCVCLFSWAVFGLVWLIALKGQQSNGIGMQVRGTGICPNSFPETGNRRQPLSGSTRYYQAIAATAEVIPSSGGYTFVSIRQDVLRRRLTAELFELLE